RQHIKSHLQRPLVCVIHGKSDEAHRPFVERVEGDTVPPVLAETRVGAQYRFVYLSRADPARSDSFAVQFRSELADKVVQYDSEDDASLVASLRERGQLLGLFCVVQLRTSDCGRRLAGVLKAIHEYWQAFPDLPEPLMIACIVCIKSDCVASGFMSLAR